jgi:hypothetical protein
LNNWLGGGRYSFFAKVHDLGCLRAFGGVFNRKLDPVAFFKVTVSLTLDGGVMDKDVLLSTIRADETVALDAAEPFDSASYSSAHMWGSSLNPSDKKTRPVVYRSRLNKKRQNGKYRLANLVSLHTDNIAEHRPQNLAERIP